MKSDSELKTMMDKVECTYDEMAQMRPSVYK